MQDLKKVTQKNTVLIRYFLIELNFILHGPKLIKMKNSKLIQFIGLIFILLNVNCNTSDKSSVSTDDRKDSIMIENIDTTYKKPIDVSKIHIDTNVIKSQYNILKNQEILIKAHNNVFKREALNNIVLQMSSFTALIDTTSISQVKSNCIYPSTIRDLKDGISLQAYDFKKGDEYSLGLMGFFNVSLQTDERITVVEFSQTGSSVCDNKTLSYGIGARLLLQVIKKKKNAKLETPQRITASVIFDRAEVKYSIKTFGITGPKTAPLIKSGTLSENTYNDFINAIADLIVDAYKPNSEYIITPQYLPLKQ